MGAVPQAARPARDHCLAPARSGDRGVASRYGRLFEDLAPLREGEAFFMRRGREAVRGEASPFVAVDGPQDGATDASVAAGWPVFAQFLAHDLTADRSALASRVEVADLRNRRGPRLDLECLYGGGPADQPYLYTRADPAKLLVGRDDSGAPRDLPRNQEGLALLADGRNDVHQLISQLHVAMLRAHNALVDRLRTAGVEDAALFEEAQRELCWHYQWIVLHDYLPTLVGEEAARRVLAEGGRELFTPTGAAYIPVEFADAAFRYGHSQVRETYRLNDGMPPARLFPDLGGFRPVPAAHAADWSMLFDLPGRPPAPQRAKRIDGRLVPSLIHLPIEITGPLTSEAHQSLAIRDLQRGVATGLPSGEAVARRLGLEPLDAEAVGVRALGWEWETPLWYYVLKEAEVLAGGDRLGPVGGRIVAEVLAGLIDLDASSHRALAPDWRPTLAAADGDGSFGLGDLLAFAAGASG